MKITLAYISPRTAAKSSEVDALSCGYLTRAARYAPAAALHVASEAALLALLHPASGKTRPHVILLDPRGPLLSSEAFASLLGRRRDGGTQHLIFAVGPADGWSPAARARADTLLSLGPMTLPHELARVVLAEQIYRALTILAGHPYHTGH